MWWICPHVRSSKFCCTLSHTSLLCTVLPATVRTRDKQQSQKKRNSVASNVSVYHCFSECLERSELRYRSTYQATAKQTHTVCLYLIIRCWSFYLRGFLKPPAMFRKFIRILLCSYIVQATTEPPYGTCKLCKYVVSRISGVILLFPRGIPGNVNPGDFWAFYLRNWAIYIVYSVTKCTRKRFIHSVVLGASLNRLFAGYTIFYDGRLWKQLLCVSSFLELKNRASYRHLNIPPA